MSATSELEDDHQNLGRQVGTTMGLVEVELRALLTLKPEETGAWIVKNKELLKSLRDVLRGAASLQIALPFDREEWERFLQLLDDAVTHSPKLLTVATGFRAIAKSSIFAPTAAVIDVDVLSDIDWGFDSGATMDVSPLRQIKQEKVSDGDADDGVEIVEGKGKKKDKGPDYATMLEFDKTVHEMMPTPCHRCVGAGREDGCFYTRVEFLGKKRPDVKCNFCRKAKTACKPWQAPEVKKASGKRKDAPVSEDVPSGRSVRSRTSTPSDKSSLRPVPIVLINARSGKSTATPVASSSRLSPNLSSQPSVILAELERIQNKIGKDMMVALVEIARIRVQVEELRKAEASGSVSLGSEGDGADDDFVPVSDA